MSKGLGLISGLCVFGFSLVLLLPTLVWSQELNSTIETKTTEPIPAVPVAPVEDSNSMRKKVEDFFSKGEKDKGIQAVKDIIVSDRFADLKEWATLALYRNARNEGNIPVIIEDLKRLELSHSHNPHLKMAIAEGYMSLRDWAQVISIYEELEKELPDDYVVRTRLTRYYLLAGQYEKAIQRLEPIVQANPDDKDHSNMLANAYAGAGMQDKAIEFYKKRIEKNPNSSELIGSYAWDLQNFGMLEESLKQWQKAYELEPRSAFYKRRIEEVSAKLGGSAKE